MPALWYLNVLYFYIIPISLPNIYPKLGYTRDLHTWRLVISELVPVTMQCH